jgi:hypothetical protein
LAATIQEPADELRRLEAERLDALLEAVWPEAMTGRRSAVESALRIMDRRSKLVGLDAPLRRAVEVVTPEALEDVIMQMESEIAENQASRHNWAYPPSARAPLQAGGHRFDPGWLHNRGLRRFTGGERDGGRTALREWGASVRQSGHDEG